jgi:anti-anti-sigma regulatory factor
MAIPSDAFTTTLSKPVTLDALQALRSDVTRALEQGAAAVLVDIDGVGTLESATIAGLIVLLRAARERGAVLSLRVGRKNLLETLRITALDRVFPIVTPLEAAGPLAPRSLRGVRVRSVASLAVGIAVVAALCGTRVDAGNALPAAATPSTSIPDLTTRGCDLSLGGQKGA